MDSSNKRGNADVDIILEELKNRGAQAPDGKTRNVDAILAEMGLGGKKPSPFDNVRPGSPMPPPVKAQPAPKAPLPQAPPAAPVFVEIALEEEIYEELDGEPYEAPYTPPYDEPEAEQEAPPAPKRKKSSSGTMIWDIEPTHTSAGPRVGKAAALDMVDTDKFVGDSELNRWFDKEATLAISKKDRKQAEKEMRRRYAEEDRAEKDKRRGKAAGLPGEAPPEEPEKEPEEFLYTYEEEILLAEIDLPEERPAGFDAPKDFDFKEKPQKKGLFSRLFGRKKAEFEDSYPQDDDGALYPPEADEALPPASNSAFDAREPEAEYEDAFAAAFDRPAKPRTGMGTKAREEGTEEAGPRTTPKARQNEPVQADTAAFAAACAPRETAPKTNTAAFAAAMRPKAQALSPDTQPEEAYAGAFAAALGKAPKTEASSGGSAPPHTADLTAMAEGPVPTMPTPASIAPGKDPNTAEFAAALGKGPVTRKPAAETPYPAKEETWNSDTAVADASAFDRTTVWDKPPADWDREESFFDAAAATTTFEAQVAETRTASFAAIKAESLEEPPPPGWKAARGEKDTRSFDLDKGGEPERVPTAAFTQEFGATGEPVPDDRSLFLDDMVDDRFRQFFSETVIVERQDEQQDPRARKRRKKSRSAILTGEFARMAEMAEQAELAELTGEDIPEEEGFDDYNRPQDAPAIEGDIAALRTTLTRRTLATAAIAALLFWMGLSFAGRVPLPEALSFAANPLVFTGVYLALLMAAIIINFTTVATGLAGLFAAPTVDCAPALAALAGLLQGAMLLVQVINKQSASATLFGSLAALVLCFNALGKRVRAVSILRNFQLASAGMDHSAAYILDSSNELAYNITKGLEEEDPTLLVSRPTALVKGFLRQSFSQRATDRTGRSLGWIALGAGLAATALTLILGQGQVNVFTAVSSFAAVLCIAAPLSSSLVSGVPSLLLQRSTARLGAVVPGWSAIEELGGINVVMAGARDIFPPSVVYLKGIKTFEKERIDVAILYAASVLIEGCDTLRDIFSGVIQGKNDMLYKVESLVQEPSRGFTAWVQNNRVVIGSREMLQKHDVTPPPMELEVKYVPAGHMPVYLAVSGKLFAMFIVGYRADREVRDTLNGLIKSGVSLLVTSDDMNVTSDLIEYAYKLPHGVVKVLGRRELTILEPLTSYIPESEGVMTHIGSFASFIGGMRSAAGCAASERMSSTVQIASVILAGVLCLLLAFGGTLPSLAISIALLYQAAWTLLVSIMPFMRRY